jgi:hypothetical protein
MLDLAGDYFASAFVFEVGIVRYLPNLFLDGAFHFVDLACDLIFGAWFHGVVSSKTGGTPADGGLRLGGTIVRKTGADICSHTDSFEFSYFGL